MLNSSRDKNEGTYLSGEGGGRRARYVTPDLSCYLEGARAYTRRARILNGMKGRKKLLLWRSCNVAKPPQTIAPSRLVKGPHRRRLFSAFSLHYSLQDEASEGQGC